MMPTEPSAPLFTQYVGIDYTGAATPHTPSSALQVFEARLDDPPKAVQPVGGQPKWDRGGVAEWLVDFLCQNNRVIVGIDHAFSFPETYMQQNELTTWDAFLRHFCERWATDLLSVRESGIEEALSGFPKDLRLTERWTPSAKSVYQFGVQGQVATSTCAGIPWLRRLRAMLGTRLHFWPFDGFEVAPGRPVVAEVYPSIFRRRYRQTGDSAHAHDAFAICRWLQERDRLGFLGYYLNPPLSELERRQAALEGWILGVT